MPKPDPTIQDKYILHNYRGAGKDYALYAGLLDAAHGMGLKGISTDVVQFGTQENGGLWVVRAVVTMADDSQYTAHGDASAATAAKGTPAATAPLRMAETRSKARALRDATNASAYEVDEDTAATPESGDPKAISSTTPSPNGSSAPPQDSRSPSGTSSAPTPPTETATARISPARGAGSGSWPSSTPTRPSSGASPRRVETPAPGGRATTAAPAAGTAAADPVPVSGELGDARQAWEEVDAEAELLGLPKVNVDPIWNNPALLRGATDNRARNVNRRKEQDRREQGA